MRLFKIFGSQLLLVAGVILLAPGAGFAQGSPGSPGFPPPDQQYYNCTPLNTYIQFCEYVSAVSTISINATSGQITVYAYTEADWGVLVNPGQCQNLSEGNPYACQAPNLPGPAASVQTTIYPIYAFSSGTGTGGAELSPTPMTAQAIQAGTYTEYSNHAASFYSGEGYNTVLLPTQDSAQLAPQITSISPSQVGAQSTNAVITLTGMGFGTTPTISIEGIGQFTGNGTNTSTQFTADVNAADAAVGTYQITATVNGLQSNAVQLNVICATPTQFEQWGPPVCSPSGNLAFQYVFQSSTGNFGDIAGCFINEYVNYAPYPPPSPPWPAGGAGYVQPTVNNLPASVLGALDNNSPPAGTFVKPYSESFFGGVQNWSYSCGCVNGPQAFPGYNSIGVTRMLTSSQGPWVYVIQKSNSLCGFNLP